MGVDARGYPGGLLRLDPAFLRMSSLLPHDLCCGWSASLWPPTMILEVQSQQGWYFQIKAGLYVLECALISLKWDASERKMQCQLKRSLEMCERE